MSCPLCGEAAVKGYRPFCSKRCADLDLAKWLNGSYAVPSQREEDIGVEISPDETRPDRPH